MPAQNRLPSSSVDVCQLNGQAPSMGAGAADAATLRVAVAGARSTKGKTLTVITSSTAEATIVAAAAAGLFRDLCCLILTNISATASEVEIRDATGGAVVSSVWVPANSSVVVVFPSNANFPQAVAAGNWTAKTLTSIASLNVTALWNETA
jgi:hypothetical protein